MAVYFYKEGCIVLEKNDIIGVICKEGKTIFMNAPQNRDTKGPLILDLYPALDLSYLGWDLNMEAIVDLFWDEKVWRPLAIFKRIR